jgi:hypothetical protein
VPTSYLPIPRTSGPNGVGPTTFDADVLGRLDELRQWGLDLDRMADYVLYREGNSYRASGALGLLFGPEPGAVLQNVIATLGTRGGHVVITGDEDFDWGSVPAVLAGNTGRLTIEARGRSKINLSTNGPRFLDCAATGSTQNVTLQGIVVDAAAIQADDRGHHLLFGNARAGVLYSQIDFRGIHFYGCKVLNARVGTSGSQGQNGIYLATQHTAAGQPRNFIEDVIIDDFYMTGGLQGVGIIGRKSGTWTGDADIWIDGITIRNLHHDIGSVPPGFAGSAHVHIGSGAQVGRVTVENVYGYGSRDVGIEINNFQDATVDTAVFDEYNGHAVFFTNHRAPRRTRDQHGVARNVHGRHLAGAGSVLSNSCCVVAVAPISASVVPIGSVDVEGGSYYSDRPDILTAAAGVGLAVRADHEMRSFSCEDFESHMVGINHTSTTAPNPRPFYIAPKNTTAQVRLSRLLSVAEGAAAAGAGAINLYHYEASGLAVLDWDDLSVRMDITGASDFGHRGANIGRLAGSNIRGTIRRFKVLSAAATQPRGIFIAGTSTLTIPNELRIEDSDFSAMPSPSSDIALSAAIDPTKVRLEGIKWRVFPLPPVGVTAGTSPWVYQATQGYRETLIVSGGTVSFIEFSRDGATWFGLGETAGMFVLDPGDQLRITHTAAPTVTRVPAK